MEAWQKKTIITNIYRLQELTVCNTALLARLQSSGVIGKADKQKIEAKPEDLEKGNCLYEIIQTRTNGYMALVTALSELKQSGALDILKQCAFKHGLANVYVKFVGGFQQLKELLSEENLQELGEVLISKVGQHSLLKFILDAQNKKNAVFLVNETIPAPPPFYIERTLSKRAKLDPQIFKEDCPDIFVITGMSRSELTELVKPNPTVTSSNQLLKITSRFIYLEYDGDWKEIRNNGVDKVIHFVKYEARQQNFFLVDTTQVSSSLQKFLKKENGDDSVPSVSESEFIKVKSAAKKDNCVCISDTPGMGKSILLANLARKTMVSEPDKIVVFIALSQIVLYLRKLISKRSETTPNALAVLVEYISSNKIQQEITLYLIQNTYAKMIICFDALDEVKSEDHKIAMQFLQECKNNSHITKFYVTARPHMKHELETTIGVISYNIIPFSRTNQEDFLVRYWHKGKDNVIVKSKLTEFAGLCLDSLRLINKTDRDILGIPLQCYLLAEVHSKEALIYSNPNRRTNHVPKFNTTGSAFEMYKAFFDMKFPETCGLDHVESKMKSLSLSALSSVNRLCTMYSNMFWNRYSTSAILNINQIRRNDESPLDRIKIRDFHIYKALQLLFPEIAEEFANAMNVSKMISSTDVLSFGILEESTMLGNEKQFVFFHQSMAEFLTAEFFAEVLTGRRIMSTYYTTFHNMAVKVLLDQVLAPIPSWIKINFVSGSYAFPLWEGVNSIRLNQFKFPLVSSFLNAHLNELDSPDTSVLKILESTLKSHRLYSIVQCSITQGCANLIHVMKVFVTKMDRQQRNDYLNFFIKKSIPIQLTNKTIYVDHSHLLFYLSAANLNVPVAKICYDLLTDCFDFHLISPLEDEDKEIKSPLCWSLTKAHYEMVEFLIDKVPMDDPRVVSWCVQNTYEESTEIIHSRIDICSLIIRRNVGNLCKSFIDDNKVYCTGPVVSRDINVKLVKWLVKNGADVFALRNGDNIITHAAMYMSSSDYEELIRFLIIDCKAFDLFRKSCKEPFNPVHTTLRRARGLEMIAIHTIMTVPGINVNEIDNFGDNLLLSAIQGIQKLEIIKELLNRKANYKLKNYQGRGALHYAVMTENVELVKLFVSLGLSVNERDNEGNTPLHLNNYIPSTMTYLLQHKDVNAFAINNKGNTIAHIAAMFFAQYDFHDLVLNLLNKHKADTLFSLKNSDGFTPLHKRLSFSIQAITLDTVKLILDHSGSQINDKSKWGNTLLISSVKCGRSVDILKTLVDFGVKLNCANCDGENALHAAVEAKNLEVVRFLLSLGVSTKQRDINNRTPFDLAIEMSKGPNSESLPGIIQIIKEHIEKTER